MGLMDIINKFAEGYNQYQQADPQAGGTMGIIKQMANNVDNYNKQKQMNAVFAANPDFAQQYYGTLNQQQAAQRQNQPQAPSAVQEYQYWNSLTPEQKKDYLRVKRSQQVVNLGGTQDVLDPITGGIAVSHPVSLKPEDRPENAAAKAAATKGAELQQTAQGSVNETARNAKSSLDIIDEAEKLLPYATGSTLGSIIATGKGAIGISDESTQANQQLKTLSGWLTSNVPRMQGPQSDKDTLMYQQMAANVGDETRPIQDRQAALQTLRALQEKYANKAKIPPSGTGFQGAQRRVINFRDLQ